MSQQLPERAADQKKALAEAVKKENRSISSEVAALRAKLPRYKKKASAAPKENHLSKKLGELEKMWDDRLQLRQKEKNLRKREALLEKQRAETEEYLKSLPEQIFGTCLELVKGNKAVPPGFCTNIPAEALEKAIKIELNWREDDGSASHDR